jgi:hypothetical protein
MVGNIDYMLRNINIMFRYDRCMFGDNSKIFISQENSVRSISVTFVITINVNICKLISRKHYMMRYKCNTN